MKIASTSHALFCPHCGAPAVTSPSPLWRLAVVPAWITVALMVAGAGLVGPFVLVLIPPLLAGGAGLLSLVHARAFAPGECEACGKIATGLPPAARVAPAVPGRATGLARAA